MEPGHAGPLTKSPGLLGIGDMEASAYEGIPQQTKVREKERQNQEACTLWFCAGAGEGSAETSIFAEGPGTLGGMSGAEEGSRLKKVSSWEPLARFSSEETPWQC